VAQEAAMPLLYVPLIMYASWMEFMTQPFVVPFSTTIADDSEVDERATRACE
jgi:hypothetical protein